MAMDRRQRNVALLVAGAFFMEMLDGTILATAAPSIARSFGVGSASIGITITAYLVTVAVLIPLSGWLADRWGARRVFMLAIAVFTIASALCAVTQTVWQLTAARVLQGCGAALMVPVGRLAVLRSIEKSDMIRAIAFLTWPALLAPVLAPLLGGLITTYASWHWIFLVNVPLGLAGFAVAWRIIPEPPRPPWRPLDWLGLVLSMIALGALVSGAESLAARGSGAVIAVELGAAAVVGVAAVLHLRRTEHPLLDLSVFRVRTFRLTQSTGAVYRMAIVGVPFLLPLLFQDGFGWSAVQAGSYVLFLFAGNVGIKPATTPMMLHFGFRPVLIGSIVLGAATMAAMAFVGPATPSWLLIVLLVVSGAARSSGFSAYNSLTFADVEPGLMPKANTLSATLQQLAEGLGVAVAALVLGLASTTTATADPLMPYEIAFLALAVLMLAPLVDVLLLHRDAGSSVRSR